MIDATVQDVFALMSFCCLQPTAGAYLGYGGGMDLMASDDVAAGQYACLEGQAFSTAGSWTLASVQQGDAVEMWTEPDAALVTAGPDQSWPGIDAEDSAAGWAAGGGTTAGKALEAAAAAAAPAPADWPVPSAGELQQRDEAEVADLMSLLGLG